MSQQSASAHEVAGHLFSHEGAKVVAALTAHLGAHRLQLAEDVVQEALLRALQTWSYHGVPDNPAAWLTQVAKNLAINALQREQRWNEKQDGIATERECWLSAPADDVTHETFADDTLRMMFVCFHPELAAEAQTALALRTLCGFSPAEIATAFLTSEAAIAKRLLRARQRIRELALPFAVPEPTELSSRLSGVLHTLYLLFNEGYKASSGDRLVREDLCHEAIRLVALLTEHPAARLSRGGMLCEQGDESDGFVTEILAHKAITARGFVAFVEEQIKRVQDSAEPRRELSRFRHGKGQRQLTDALPGAKEPLCDGGLAGEKSGGDFSGAESAKCAERQGGLGLGGEFGVEADKHHPQRVVGKGFVRHIISRGGQPALALGGDAILFLIPSLLTLQRIDCEVLRHLSQPRGGIVRHAVVRPRLQRAQQRLLHHVLGKLKPVGAEMRGECGDHFRAFMAEQMAGHLMCAGTLLAHLTSLTFQLGDVANLQLTAAFNHRAVASDFHGLIHSLHIEYEKASNGFLRLREDAIGNGDFISS